MNNFNISEGAKADIRRKVLERNDKIESVRNCYKEAYGASTSFIRTNIQFLERLLKACGAENNLHLISVSEDVICIGTRIPMTAVLHPYATQFKDLNIDNPLFHRTVLDVLIQDLRDMQSLTWRKDKDYPELNILEVRFS